jgi:hypothetical protein
MLQNSPKHVQREESLIPKEQETPLYSASITLHEVYLSLQEAGFKKKEALYIIATMAANASDE